MAMTSIRLDPEYSVGHAALCGFLTHQLRYGDALTAARRAIELCPASAQINANLTYALFRSGEFHESLVANEAASRMSPRDPRLVDRLNQQAALRWKFNRT
jgi:cytochrome c-type biogenesis protein CcmH/NrfG